jgi:hypothetical protein
VVADKLGNSIRLHNFRSYVSPYTQGNDGSHGVAILVSKEIESFEFCPATETTVHVAAVTVSGVVLYISAYFANRSKTKKQTKSIVAKVIRLFRIKYPEGEVVMTCDANEGGSTLSKWLAKDVTGINRIKMENEGDTSIATATCYTRTQVVKGVKRTSTIDHVCASPGLCTNDARVSGMYTIGISDHIPLLFSFKTYWSFTAPPARRAKIDLDLLKDPKIRSRVTNSKKWSNFMRAAKESGLFEDNEDDENEPYNPVPIPPQKEWSKRRVILIHPLITIFHQRTLGCRHHLYPQPNVTLLRRVSMQAT